MRRFLFGFATYFRGLKTWLSHRSLLKLSIIPFFLDLLGLVVGIYYTLTHFEKITAHFVHRPEFWYQFIVYYLILAIAALSLFFIVLFLVFIVANLVALPFNDLLAEKTLSLHNALPIVRENGSRARVSKSLRNMGAMLKKLPILVVAGLFMTVAAFVPGLGILAAMLGVFLMAMDRIDYASDHHQLSFKERMGFVRRNFPEMVGFAAALGFTTALPFFNILLMPGGVVAGAILFAELRTPEKN
jgi:CysZ protein